MMNPKDDDLIEGTFDEDNIGSSVDVIEQFNAISKTIKGRADASIPAMSATEFIAFLESESKLEIDSEKAKGAVSTSTSDRFH